MANKITLLRIVSLPLLVWFLAGARPLMAALALVTFVLLAVTDWLDGWVARRLGQVTPVGKLLDPVADKLLVMTALLPLVARGQVPAWLGIVVLGREFLINGLRMIAAAEHRIMAAGRWGKLKTVFYIVAISLIIASPIFPAISGPVRRLGLLGLVLGALLGVASAAEYFLAYHRSEPPPPGAEPAR